MAVAEVLCQPQGSNDHMGLEMLNPSLMVSWRPRACSGELTTTRFLVLLWTQENTQSLQLQVFTTFVSFSVRLCMRSTLKCISQQTLMK